ncbi:MAG: anaphase promoting complex subunit doc1 [Chrysothrix sp. TS-e1954]|nr:MAG: anaphase promoting complex subunit doc1 [Chrysothrix sp. TS-e1954]
MPMDTTEDEFGRQHVNPSYAMPGDTGNPNVIREPDFDNPSDDAENVADDMLGIERLGDYSSYDEEDGAFGPMRELKGGKTWRERGVRRREEYHTPVVHHPFDHLKEISSLAKWTVSSCKPGCGVAALRHPDTRLFWQSDGPQPHSLNIHFFRWVTIAYIRFNLDFILDESYTPTRLQLWAGTGHHDLLMVTEMNMERPKGWIPIDLSLAGGPSEFREEENEMDDVDDDVLEANSDATSLARSRAMRALGRGPTLRCMLVQFRILENHQNGKDTHLRGLQFFSKDEVWAKSRRQPPRRSAANDGPGANFSRLTSDEENERYVEQTFAGTRHGVWDEEPILR